jgi:hypothetical protein
MSGATVMLSSCPSKRGALRSAWVIWPSIQTSERSPRCSISGT